MQSSVTTKYTYSLYSVPQKLTARTTLDNTGQELAEQLHIGQTRGPSGMLENSGHHTGMLRPYYNVTLTLLRIEKLQ